MSEEQRLKLKAWLESNTGINWVDVYEEGKVVIYGDFSWQQIRELADLLVPPQK